MNSDPWPGRSGPVTGSPVLPKRSHRQRRGGQRLQLARHHPDLAGPGAGRPASITRTPAASTSARGAATSTSANCCDENVEVDLYTGFRGGDAITWDVGLIYYFYPGADDLDFPEIYVGLGWEWLSGKISYSNDFGNSDESAFYYEANAAYDLPANFGVTGHIGYSDGDRESTCSTRTATWTGRSA